jgi:hypothetical protein
MIIRLTAGVLTAIGFMLFMMGRLVPLLAFFYMDWIGAFMMMMAVVILIFIFGSSQTGLQYDSIPAGCAIVNYIRRDGMIVPLLGKRVFSGESFLDVPRIGLIEDFGKDTVFLWGKKKIRFGLENINYTPDPRYWNLTKELYDLGIDDSDDLFYIMNIPNITDKDKKEYYLSRMAQVYYNMKHQDKHGVHRLMDIFRKKRDTTLFFGRKREHEIKLKDEGK